MIGKGDWDLRLTPARPDLAADYLKGQVEADRFVSAVQRQCVAPVSPIRPKPDASGGQLSELLFGEMFETYEDKGGWSWGRNLLDGYVGYVASADMSSVSRQPTHRVCVMRTFVYPKPDMKLSATAALPLNAKVSVVASERRFSRLENGGWIFSDHIAPTSQYIADYVATAHKLLGVPYLWGGKTPLGADCSGLVQLVLEAAGVSCPRDSDMQAMGLNDSLGEALPFDQTPRAPVFRRGDLVYFPGHVGIMTDSRTLLHANARNMAVTVDPLSEVTGRIENAQDIPSGGAITAVRRIDNRYAAQAANDP